MIREGCVPDLDIQPLTFVYMWLNKASILEQSMVGWPCLGPVEEEKHGVGSSKKRLHTSRQPEGQAEWRGGKGLRGVEAD